MIQLTKIEPELRLNCPHCGHTRLLVKTGSAEVPDGDAWLTDGDTLLGLDQRLVEAGLETKINFELLSFNYDCEVLLGSCPACAHEYFVISAKLIDEAVQVDPDFVLSYFFPQKRIPEPTYLMGKIEGKGEWLVGRHATPKGILLEHHFGPFSVEGETMKGPFGVSACSGSTEVWDFASDFVFDLWPELKELARRANRGE